MITLTARGGMMAGYLRQSAGGLFLALILFCGAASADSADAMLDGLVDHPLHLSTADLAALPPTELDITFQTGHGTETTHYKGVSLWTLVQRAGLSVEPGNRRNSLHHYVLVTGRDGYAVAISMGELDPDFEGKEVILAYARDDKPLGADGLRLIVPGDKHGGRAVRDVTHLEVK
jgi:DMSO/TMAO reductase YedYZ molybdopterin-dependent catalytic subunit